MTDTIDQSMLGKVDSEDLPVLRHRLAVQSFLNLPDETLFVLRNWWRFTPTLNWGMTLIGTVMAWPELLFVQAAIMVVALITPSHPFDWLYNYGVRFLSGTPLLPKSGQRRKMIFVLAAVLNTLLAALFLMGYTMAAYIMGGIMSALGGLLMLMNLCVASELIARLFGAPTR